MVTNLKSKVWGTGEKLVSEGKQIDHLMFFYTGVAHLNGYCDWQGTRLYFPVVMLEMGSWFGDY